MLDLQRHLFVRARTSATDLCYVFSLWLFHSPAYPCQGYLLKMVYKFLLVAMMTSLSYLCELLHLDSNVQAQDGEAGNMVRSVHHLRSF